MRATALACLIERGGLAHADAERALDEAMQGAPAVRIALARAIGKDASARGLAMLASLSASPEPEVRLEVAWAMGRTERPEFIAKLISLVAEPIEGSGARDALACIGEPALVALDRAMGDSGTKELLVVALPRAISMFEPALAAPVLLRHLALTKDGMLRYRVLRALGRLRTMDPDLSLDVKVLSGVLEETIKKALVLLEWRHTVDGHGDGEPPSALRTLLVTILRDKETHAASRAMRVLALLHPGENFDRIARGLVSRDTRARSASRELVENLVGPSLRATVLAVIDDAPVERRLASALPQHRPAVLGFAVLLRALITRDDELGLVASHYAREVGLGDGAPTPRPVESVLGSHPIGRESGRGADA